MNRFNRDRHMQAATDQKTLAKIEKAIARVIAAIEDGGMYQPSIKARMDELERLKAEIVKRLTEVPASISNIHLNPANLYHLRVERLSEAFNYPDGGRNSSFSDR